MRWWRWIAGAVLAVVAVLATALVVVDTSIGHRWVTQRIDEVRLANGLRFSIGRIDGSLYADTRLRDLRVYDLDGLVFRAKLVELDWSPARWFVNRLDIDRLAIPDAVLLRTPHTRPGKPRGAILPEFDIRIGQLALGRLRLAAPVLGRERVAQAAGRANIRAGRALVVLSALVGGSDRLRLRLDAEPDRDRFDIDVAARGGADGVLARMAGNHGAVTLDVGGEGRWTQWKGRAAMQVGTARVADLALTARAGRYAVSGMIAPSSLLGGKLQRLTAPRVAVAGEARFADRRLDGRLRLRSASLAATATGAVDLGVGAYRNFRIDAQLLQPSALFPNMTGQRIALRAMLDGAFATARFAYHLDAARFAFDDTGFEDVHASGTGRLSRAPAVVPVRFTAARVTGVGDVAGGILRGLLLEGRLHVTPALLTGEDLLFRSDKLSGRIGLSLDLRTGQYQVGLNGALGRYLISGLGVVDVASTLRVVPGPGGHGTRVVGSGSARMLRLDNAFFRSLTGGLPQLQTGLERTPDGFLHLNALVLTAPQLRLVGNGYRRRDGSFHVEGQRTAGAVRSGRTDPRW